MMEVLPCWSVVNFSLDDGGETIFRQAPTQVFLESMPVSRLINKTITNNFFLISSTKEYLHPSSKRWPIQSQHKSQYSRRGFMMFGIGSGNENCECGKKVVKKFTQGSIQGYPIEHSKLIVIRHSKCKPPFDEVDQICFICSDWRRSEVL